MKIICLLNAVLFCSTIYCQPITFTVKAGVSAVQVLPGSFRNLYPEYRKGYLFFWTGKRSPISKFNYDMLLRTMVYINEKNDTLPINDEAVKYAYIGSEKFFHNNKKGYFKILVTDSVHSLTSHEQLEEVKQTMQGSNGYGSTDASSAIYAQRSVGANRFTKNVDVTYGRVTEYFLMDQNDAIIKPIDQVFETCFRIWKTWLNLTLRKKILISKRKKIL